jgi:hypothetical protein
VHRTATLRFRKQRAGGFLPYLLNPVKLLIGRRGVNF